MEKVKKILGGERITVQCETCGELFLNMNYLDFLEKHSSDPEQPDKWFVRGALHYLLNKEHIIMAYIPMLPTNLTEMYKTWRDEKIYDYGSEEAMIQEMHRYLDRCTLPI